MSGYMTELEVDKCQLQDKIWKCPECNKILTRKQTLKSHLRVVHSIRGGVESKRYKQYEYTDEGVVPKSTFYRWKKTDTAEETVSDIREGGQEEDTLKEAETIQTQHEEELDTAPEICEGDQEENTLKEAETIQTQHEEELDRSCYYKVTDNELTVTNNELTVEDHNIDIDNYDVIDMDITDKSSSEEEAEESDSEEVPQLSTTDYELEQKNESPALYNLFRSELNSEQVPISHLHHMLSICAYSTAHNLSGVAVQDLLNLVRLHVPPNNICETKLYDLKAKCGFNDAQLQHHDYCIKCCTLFPEDLNVDICTMQDCGGRRFLGKDKVKNVMFVTNDIESQLIDILQRSGNWEKVRTQRESPVEKLGVIADITSAEGYRKLMLPGGFLDKTNLSNITLTWNTDGIPLFKSSSVSLWPVFLAINELPPKERFLRKNVIIWGIWQGTSKPPFNTFLYRFVRDASKLYHKGFDFVVHNEKVHCRAMILTGTMDLQARAYVLNQTQHNGAYSCLYCEEEGKSVRSGDGNCRSYQFPAETVTSRTRESFLQNAEESSLSGKPVRGVFGPTVITHLPEFSPDHIVIDYMHGILLGITKKLLGIWIDGKSYTKDYFIGHQTNILDKSMASIKPPYLISRLPRKIKNTFNKWKASELRSWLLFYSLPCLSNILPQIYLEHFSCLVEGTYLLLKDAITSTDLERANTVFRSFYENASVLYGDNIMGLNVHNLFHLVSCAQMWGPLWAWSCFGFESCNGEILRTVHGKGNVCSQIFWNMQAQKRLELEVKHLPPGQVRDFFKSQLRGGSRQPPPHDSAYECDVVLPINKALDLTEELASQLMEMCQLQQIDLERYGQSSKILRNGYTFYSQKCTKVKKRNSYTALLEIPLHDGSNVVQINGFFIDTVTMKVFALCSTFSTMGPVIAGRAPHVQVLEKIKENVLVSAANLKELLVFMSLAGKNIVARFPNFVERD